MPVLRVWEAENVIVFKRSMASGYAGVQNPLFFRENSRMLFGDAKQSVEGILRALSSSDAAQGAGGGRAHDGRQPTGVVS
jgi:NAD(P) transhydrogenase subunit beta